MEHHGAPWGTMDTIRFMRYFLLHLIGQKITTQIKVRNIPCYFGFIHVRSLFHLFKFVKTIIYKGYEEVDVESFSVNSV